MPDTIGIEAIHHLTLTVTDVGRAREFYTSLFGFEVAGEFGLRVVLIKGSALLAQLPTVVVRPPTIASTKTEWDSIMSVLPSATGKSWKRRRAYSMKDGCPTGKSLTWNPSEFTC